MNPVKRRDRSGSPFNHASLVPFAALLFFMASCLPARAINFNTAGKLPAGFYLNLYPYWYAADTRVDKDGKVVIDNLGLDKYGVYVSGSYYTGNLLFNLVVPFSRFEIDAADESATGLGDVQIRAGYFLPLKRLTILPAAAVKLPTGSFDKDRKVNLGDGQTDLMAELYLSKIFEKLSLDWVFKYSRRLYNHKTDIKPGDEFITEGLITGKLSDNLRLGPSVVFIAGDDPSSNGKTFKGSGQKKLACGGELFYRGFTRAKLSVSVLKDVYTRNATEGTLLLSRVTIPF